MKKKDKLKEKILSVKWDSYGETLIPASPLSGDAYCNRHLTYNFELGAEIFVFPCFDMRIPNHACLSIYPEKRNHPFNNISPTVVNDTSMGSS